MRKIKLTKTIVSIIIIGTMLFDTLPTTFAIDEKDEIIPSAIVREETDLREESSKTFICEDGSYLAVTYSEPIHFKTESGWQDVNNTLVLSENEKYSPVALGYNVSLPLNISNKNSISIGDGEKTVSFAPISEQKDEISAFASKTDVEKLASNAVYKDTNGADDSYNENPEIAKIERHNETFTSVKNQRSALVYKNVFTGIDYEYIVSSSNLKENIVINRKQEEYKFSFEIDMAGLTPVCNENGSIIFIDSEKAVVFSVPAPYMYDMNKEESSAVEMSLDKSDEKYILTISADSDWINSGERAFPVIIDPTYNFPTDSINNVFVEDLVFANSTRITNELRAGKNLLNLTRTYIKTLLPTTIPYGSVITSAKLTLYKENYYQAPSQSNINIVACDCSNVTAWDANTVTWNNQPFSNEANGYKSVSGYQITSVAATSDKANYVFELKTVAQKWLNTGTNKGIMLASSNENSKTQVDFYSTRVNTSTKRPKMEIAYNNPGIGTTLWEPSCNAEIRDPISVICSPAWTITSNQSWLSYSSKTTTSFKPRVTKNNGSNPRTGTLQIISGSTLIGTVIVTQSSLNLSVNSIYFEFGKSGGTKQVSITSNSSWSAFENTSWINLDQINGNGNGTISITVSANNTNNLRTGNVSIQAGDLSYAITIKQHDSLSELFTQQSNNGKRVLMDSEQYHHSIAKWGMELSDCSYNPLIDNANPLIGWFSDENRTVANALCEKNFEYHSYNYESGETLGHTIAHRKILSNGNEKDLIVVVIRGTETWGDIYMDIINGIEPNSPNGFAAGCELVKKSLFGRGNNYQCNNCNGMGCLHCRGYVSYNNISGNDAAFMIVGHSLGAAIANLLTKELNYKYRTISNKNKEIFGYTFGTPYVATQDAINSSNINCNNLFNILNANDVVTFVPATYDFNNHIIQTWGRYGRDFRFDMPFDSCIIPFLNIDITGLFGHGMRTYVNWFNVLPNILQKTADQITINDLNSINVSGLAKGLLPKIVKIKCPVDITVSDSNGSIIAYEGRDNPEIEALLLNNTSDIVSWTDSNNEKIFYIPYGDDDYIIDIEAYDYGFMNYSLEIIGIDNPIDSYAFNSVNLYPGKEFITEVSSEIDIEDTSLYIVEEGVVVGEVTETNPMLKSVTLSLNETQTPPYTMVYVCDSSTEMIRISRRGTYFTETYYITSGYFNTEYNDDEVSLIITYNYPDSYYEYDVSVYVNGEWYYYDNVFALSPAQEQ